MALPVPDKTWNHKVNQIRVAVNYYPTENKLALMTVKESMKALGWTVTGSGTGWSGGASGAMDGVDRWPGLFIGTDTNANVNTSTNNTLRIRTAPHLGYTIITVTAGASTPKTTIVTDLNTAFAAAGLNLLASVVGTNQLQIADTTTLGYIGIDTVASGCTLSTAVGFPSAGFSTIDKIVSATAGTNHSWIVLKNTNIFSTFEVCLDASTNTDATFYQMTIVVGLSGFTGGSATNRPTATTSITTLSAASWISNGTNNISYIIDVLMSTDGECTRVVGLTNGTPTMFWLFDKPKNPVAGWTNPAIFFTFCNNVSSAMGWLSYQDTARVNFYANALPGVMYMGCEGGGTTSLPEWVEIQRPNQINGENHIFPIGLVSDTTSLKGRHGQIYDLWVGNISANALGGYADTVYPTDGSRQFWQCDDFIQVWPGYTSPPGPLPITDY